MMKTENNHPIKSVLAILLGLIILYLVTAANWAIYSAVAVGFAGLVSSRLSLIIHYLWMKLAFVLTFLVPKILLIFIFYFILFPLSLLSKVFGKADPLILKNRLKSTFIQIEKKFDKQSFERPW